MQVVTVDATGGTFRLGLYLPKLMKTLLTEALQYDASAEQVRRALQHELARELNDLGDDADLSRTREAFKSDFSVVRVGNSYLIGFQGVTRNIDGGQGVSYIQVDDTELEGTATVLTRMDGIQYYGIEELNLDLGAGDDVLNVQSVSDGSYQLERDAVHASTNVNLADGDDSIFISSDANLDHATIDSGDRFDFLTGNLDGIQGNLNLNAGIGTHQLLISDESATAGDDGVYITDTGVAATGTDTFGNATNREIQVQGLAFGDIAYGAAGGPTDASGNFFGGVVYWTGSGDDTIDIDGTHYRADERTTTALNTGLGDDHVTVDLDSPDDEVPEATAETVSSCCTPWVEPRAFHRWPPVSRQATTTRCARRNPPCR